MHIYVCHLTLMENTFFSSREISATYQTEPLIGNIALAYAFGFCQSPYFNDGTIYYGSHLGGLNVTGVYVTPATIVGRPRFTLGYFNAQPDTYWYAMGAGTLVSRPDDGWAEGAGKTWRIVRAGGERSKIATDKPSPIWTHPLPECGQSGGWLCAKPRAGNGAALRAPGEVHEQSPRRCG